MSIFLLRKLGEIEYGLYQTIVSFANYLVLLQFGTGTVMSRNISICRSKKDLEGVKNNIVTIIYVSMLLALLILGVAIVFELNISNIYAHTMNSEQISEAKVVFVVVVIYIISAFFLETINGILLGFENYTFAQTANVVKIITRTIVLLFAVNSIAKALVVASVDALISIIVFLITFISIKKKYKISLNPKYIERRILVEAMPLCLAIFLQSIVNQANNNVDKFIIGVSLKLETVTLYSITQYIYSIFLQITSAPISLYMPQVANDIVDGKKGHQLTESLIEPCRIVAILGGTILFGFISCGKNFIKLLYGLEYMSAWEYAIIIMIPMYINMINGVIVNVLDVLNKRIIRSLILIMTTVLNIVMTIMLINKYEILGAVMATAIATIIGQIVIMNIYYQKKIKIEILYLFKKSLKGVLFFQIFSCFVSYIITNIINNDCIALISGIIVYISISFSLMYNFGFNKNEKNIIKTIYRRIRK